MKKVQGSHFGTHGTVRVRKAEYDPTTVQMQVQHAQVNQATAKATLTQILSIVFQRMETHFVSVHRVHLI